MKFHARPLSEAYVNPLKIGLEKSWAFAFSGVACKGVDQRAISCLQEILDLLIFSLCPFACCGPGNLNVEYFGDLGVWASTQLLGYVPLVALLQNAHGEEVIVPSKKKINEEGVEGEWWATVFWEVYDKWRSLVIPHLGIGGEDEVAK